MSNRQGTWETSDGTFRMEYGFFLRVTENGVTSEETVNEMGLATGDIKFGMLGSLSDYSYSFKVNNMVSANQMEVTVTCSDTEGNEIYEKVLVLYKVESDQTE